MRKIKTITIMGANGTMGSNISGIFASFGNAKVYMISRKQEQSEIARIKACKSVKADSIAENLIPHDYSHLQECVNQSDLVLECLSEDIGLKCEMIKKIAPYISDNTIICSGTSGLPINALAKCLPENLRSNFCGVHFFNPPYSMTLCELIPSQYTASEIVSELNDYLKNDLLRTVVEVKDKPAFLGNRIGFQFINEALQYAEVYKDNGGIDYIDAILGSFTGRTMAPLMTSDFVGLDVHKAIVENIYNNTCDYAHETFVLPEYVQTLVNQKQLGRKTGGGLYKTVQNDNGTKRRMVYDIGTNTYRDIILYAFPFADKMKRKIADGDYKEAFECLINNHSLEAEICLSFLLKYIIYSLYSSKEVGYSIESADDVMATGFNWCPPLAMFYALSLTSNVCDLIKERIPDICEKIDVDSYLSQIGKESKYDYRSYFKSGR